MKESDLRKAVLQHMIDMISNLVGVIANEFPNVDRDKMEVFLIRHVIHEEEVDEYLYEVIDDWFGERQVAAGERILESVFGKGSRA